MAKLLYKKQNFTDLLPPSPLAIYEVVKVHGGDSQNFLQNFLNFFVTLGLLFEADIIKGGC